MFLYDKDMERVMQHKKREVIKELEDCKNRILKELSGVDKITLTRLREIIADYNRIDFNINEKIKTFMSNGQIVIDGAEEIARIFQTEIDKLHELEETVGEIIEDSVYLKDTDFGLNSSNLEDFFETASMRNKIALFTQDYEITSDTYITLDNLMIESYPHVVISGCKLDLRNVKNLTVKNLTYSAVVYFQFYGDDEKLKQPFRNVHIENVTDLKETSNINQMLYLSTSKPEHGYADRFKGDYTRYPLEIFNNSGYFAFIINNKI